MFSNIHCENWVEILEVKVTKVWDPHTCDSPWSFQLSDLSTLSLQQVINYSLGFSALTLVPTEVCLWVSPLRSSDSL